MLLSRHPRSSNSHADEWSRGEGEEDVLRGEKSNVRFEDFSKRQPPPHQTSLHRRCPKLTTELEPSVRPDEVEIAAEQLDVIFETFLPPGLTDRSATEVG